MVAIAHESLEVSPDRGLWSWFSQTPAHGQRALGSGEFRIAFIENSSRIDVSKDEFAEVLKVDRRASGVAYPEQGSKDSPRAKAAAERRAREDILERYLQVAEAVAGFGILCVGLAAQGVPD